MKYYFLCAVAGGATYVLVRWGSGIPSVGASGAIYGILMAYGMWFPNRQVYIWFLFPVRVRYLVVFLIAIEFLQSIEQTGAGIVTPDLHLSRARLAELVGDSAARKYALESALRSLEKMGARRRAGQVAQQLAS